MNINKFCTILILFFVNIKSNDQELERELKNNFIRVTQLYNETKTIKHFNYSYVQDVLIDYKRLQKIISILPQNRVHEIIEELKCK